MVTAIGKKQKTEGKKKTDNPEQIKTEWPLYLEFIAKSFLVPMN